MGVSGDLGLASSEFALISSVMYYTPETWAFVFIEMDYLSRVFSRISIWLGNPRQCIKVECLL